jgi:hypothetical protein
MGNWRDEQIRQYSETCTCPIDGTHLSRGNEAWPGEANSPFWLLCRGYYAVVLCDSHGWSHSELHSIPGRRGRLPRCASCGGGSGSLMAGLY